ncbi:NAD(P)H-binding protein [Kitasatospora aureofaciens]|nr:NAD(P)H-binding protein [Kitasatospora aureofaciens]
MIVVTGATGTVGSKVVVGLRERGETVRALVRNPGEAPAEWDDAVERVAADFSDPASLDAALAGADVVYLLVAVHPEMAAHERNVIDAAVRTGRRPRIVLHAAAGVEQRPAGVRFVASHVAGLDHLQASGLPWTVIAPNGFYQNFLGMAQAVQAGWPCRAARARCRTSTPATSRRRPSRCWRRRGTRAPSTPSPARRRCRTASWPSSWPPWPAGRWTTPPSRRRPPWPGCSTRAGTRGGRRAWSSCTGCTRPGTPPPSARTWRS